MQKTQNEMDIPVGAEYLKVVRDREELCEATFASWVPSAGTEVLQALGALGTLLSWLDCIASCKRGCRGGDHLEEHLIGKAVGNASAALLLLKVGYFDAASGVIRQLGETSNLLYLFLESDESYMEWRNADEENRRKRFSPVKVRVRLERLSLQPLIDEDQYKILSQYGVHVGPGTEPQSCDPSGVLTIGIPYRPAASLLAIFTVESLVITGLLYGINLLQSTADRKEALNIISETLELLINIDRASLSKRSEEVLPPASVEATESALSELQHKVRAHISAHLSFSVAADSEARERR